MRIFDYAITVGSFIPTLATAQNVFAHVIVGNTASYDINKWKSDITLAKSYGIDAFVLNIAMPFEGSTATQMSYALQAANSLTSTLNFKMFFSFDYLGGSGPWPNATVISILQAYNDNGAYFTVDGRMMVSTFEGNSNTQISDWQNEWTLIRNSVPGGIYFVPDWTSKGPTFDRSVIDGAFSWDMWPEGPNDVSTTSDNAWDANWLAPAGKSYMMGVSPWFYTDLPQYHKAYFWRGDKSWYLRWQQTTQILPIFVQIVTWNDYGESHYIGPIVESGIPSGAATYVDNHPHTAWLATLPYQIAAYKHAYNNANPAPAVASGSERIVYWYRTSPASAGTTDATGNNCPSPINTYWYQPTCYSPSQIFQDAVFAIVLASQSGTASITIGGSTTSYSVSAGINFISKDFAGSTGTVSVSMGNVHGSGVQITAQPASGVANFNPWTGCAGPCPLMYKRSVGIQPHHMWEWRDNKSFLSKKIQYQIIS